jgi:hypothetical protein
MVSLTAALAVVALVSVIVVIVAGLYASTNAGARRRISMEEMCANSRLRRLHNDAMRRMNDAVREFSDIDEKRGR